MEKPLSASSGPYAIAMEPGTYWWCACGRSTNQPFCDGSHKGTPFRPVKLEVTEAKKLYFCGCKHTHNPPFCDGSHKSLSQG